MNKEVDNYIKRQKSPQKEILKKIRKLIKNRIPLAEERLVYGVPAFQLHGKSVLYASFKKHIGLYPEPKIIETFRNELQTYQTSKGTIKFYLDKPIPYDLIRRIISEKYGV